jgi:predicted O-linked N-acetylglucosamine transferase (SPINDLY family)
VNAPRPQPRASAGRRLRVGYVSHDFKRHSVAYFMEGVLESHDRTRFDIHAYMTNAVPDAVTVRLKALCDGWVECAHMSDAQIDERVRADGIDILVDLSGLTSGTRLGLFQRRPAPCQITYLGYPTSTGASCFDFRITDAVIDLPGDEAFSSEVLLRCPVSMFCYRPGEAPPVRPAPASRHGFITFGSFNNLAKVGEHTLRLWLELLLAVPDAHLHLKSPAFLQRGNRDHMSDYFAERGIGRERVVLQPWRPDVQAHLDDYAELDVALDCFPFNGATTTCEALYMGVPVVSLAGRTHASRMGASILGACGLGEFVARDDAQYVAMASALAGDRSRLSELRAGLRDRLQRSRLLDKTAFTRDFEALLSAAHLSVEARARVASAG